MTVWAVAAVAPVLTGIALVDAPAAPVEVVDGWFWAFSSSRGNSNRPRNKEVVVVAGLVVVFCFCPDWDMVECEDSVDEL